MSVREPSSRTRQAADDQEMTRVLECIRHIGRSLRVGGRAAEQTVGVSGAQLCVLQQLQKAPAQSLNELADRTLTHQSSVSVVVSRLVQRRFVTRTASPNDGRRVVLSLTPAGRALLSRAPEAAQMRLMDGLRQLPQRRVRELAQALRALVETMEALEQLEQGEGKGHAGGAPHSNGSTRASGVARAKGASRSTGTGGGSGADGAHHARTRS